MACDKPIPKEIIDLHNEMVLKLKNEAFGNDLIDLKILFSNDNPLSPADLDDIGDMGTLVRYLMKNETIEFGKYEKLIQNLEKVHTSMATLVEEYVKKMNSVVITQSGTSDVSPRTEPPTEDNGIKHEAVAQTLTEPSRPGQVGADFQLLDGAAAQDAKTEKD